MVLLHSKVPDEVGSSPSMTTRDLTPVSFWLGLLLSLCSPVPVTPAPAMVMFAAQYLCAIGCLWSAPSWSCVGFMCLSQRDRLCSCPCKTPGIGQPTASRGATNTNVLSCCTAQALSPLGSAKHQADPKLQMHPGVIIISISCYHNEMHDRKELAVRGTKPARCSQFLFSQF